MRSIAQPLSRPLLPERFLLAHLTSGQLDRVPVAYLVQVGGIHVAHPRDLPRRAILAQTSRLPTSRSTSQAHEVCGTQHQYPVRITSSSENRVPWGDESTCF